MEENPFLSFQCPPFFFDECFHLMCRTSNTRCLCSCVCVIRGHILFVSADRSGLDPFEGVYQQVLNAERTQRYGDRIS